MPNDNMPYTQEERDMNWVGATSSETGGRGIPGFYDTPPVPGNTMGSNNMRQPNLTPNEPPMDVGNPQTVEEAYLGSLQAVLRDSLGYFVVIEFLIGTNGLTEKEGILFSVGNNFVTLYEQETDRYIVCDLFSVKFITFFRQSPNVNPGNVPYYNNFGGMVPRNY